MTEGRAPDRTEPLLSGPEHIDEGFPVVGEPPPPPGASPKKTAGADVYDDHETFDDHEPFDDHEHGAYRAWEMAGQRRVAMMTKGRKVARVVEGHLRGESPWILGSAALLFALAAYWLGSILTAFQHAPAMTGQERVLLLLAPGNFVWAAAVVLAVALHAAGRHFELAPAELRPLRSHLPGALLAAAIVSGTAAGLDVLVELSNLGHGIDRALAGMLGYIGVIGLAGVAAWWAHRESLAITTPATRTPDATRR